MTFSSIIICSAVIFAGMPCSSETPLNHMKSARSRPGFRIWKCSVFWGALMEMNPEYSNHAEVIGVLE